jgi:predicted ATPase
MIEAMEFTNFKALRKTTLPLAPFTLLLGPNGSGKTSVLQALQGIAALAATQLRAEQAKVKDLQALQGIAALATQAGLAATQAGLPLHAHLNWASCRSITAEDRTAPIEIKLRLRRDEQSIIAVFHWQWDLAPLTFNHANGTNLPPGDAQVKVLLEWLGRMQVYALDFSAIAQPAQVNAGPLQRNGAGLAAVLDDLKDNYPDRWELLLAEMRRWLPEYDHILFDKPQAGSKAIVLRTKKGGHRIPASALSQGTLVALALLTLAYLPNPPSLMGLEEIDRGLHPRLLRHLQDALYRLSYPENYGELRPPTQVIATTHSPYLLDLYREHPEEIVLAQKEGLEVQMKRLADIEHYDEILGDAPLGEVWYSGILGGVSVKP